VSDAERPRSRDLAVTALVALGARLVIVALAWDRFPPADDGVLYDTLARRLAAGQGYTWAWADGVVTPVAHYPVGYPALLAMAYRALGAWPHSALLLHALIGAIGAVGIHVVAGWGTSRRAGVWAGLLVALHPALLTYTSAVMTEGVCSALLAVPFALALRTRDARQRGWAWGGTVLAGAVLGGVALVRPQVLLLAPGLAWLASLGARRERFVALVWVALGIFAVIAPWTLRNERAFGRPVLVSANGGWNLLIGTDAEAHGTWSALDPPGGCKEVWGEASKDECFGRVARQRIEEAPGAWLRLVPEKLAVTFDVGGSGASYLSRARPDLVQRWMVLAAGAVETLFERVMVLAALLALALERGARGRLRLGLGLVSSMFLFVHHAWPAYVGLALLLPLGGAARLHAEPIRGVAWLVLASTILTHAVFFGAGRYGLLVYPWIGALACAVLASWIEGRRVAVPGRG
jgi:4-amino-4-deoxy-L-arabinose transferase-like glycosyltransferase